MQYHNIRVLEVKYQAEDILYLRTEKPKSLNFRAGQAIEISIQKPEWENIERPFAITSAPDAPYLSFMIKGYPSQAGFLNQIFHLKKGDKINLGQSFGSLHYKGEGTFIAGGVGIAPFLSIFSFFKGNNIKGDNQLIFANKTADDIILEEELQQFFGTNLSIILSHEINENYDNGFVDKAYLQEKKVNLSGNFYLCGPPTMLIKVEKHLIELGVDKENIII